MKSMAMRSIAMVVVLMAQARLWAEQPKGDPADEKALHELHRAFVAAFNKGNVDALAALHAPEADFIGIAGDASRGRDEIEKRMATFFAQNKGVKMKSPFGTVRFITPEVAIADRSSELTPAPEGRPGKVHGTVVYVKRDGKWLIAAIRLVVPFQPSKH